MIKCSLIILLLISLISCNKGKDFDCVDDYKDYIVVEKSINGFYTVSKSNCKYEVINLPQLYNYSLGDTIGKVPHEIQYQRLELNKMRIQTKFYEKELDYLENLE